MRLKFFLLSLCALFFAFKALAQLPAPCPSTTPPADLCSDACLYSSFDSLFSTTVGYTSQTPPGFCGSIESEQWVRFIATAPTMKLSATPENCTDGNGIQIAIYENCSDDPIACNGGCGGCGSVPAEVTVGLVPGQSYFLMVDGFAGDQCSFRLSATPPISTGDSLVAPALLNGPDTACLGGIFTYSVAPVQGAAYYTWTAPPGVEINGLPSPAVIYAAHDGHEVSVFIGSPAAGEICVAASNGFFTTPPVCAHVTPTLQPTLEYPPVTVCFEDAPYILPWGGLVYASGNYQNTLTSPFGCDTLVSQRVTVRNPIIKTLPPQFVCTGDTLFVCGQPFTESGPFFVTCQSWQGCDSAVTGSLVFTVPKPVITASGQTLDCVHQSLTLTASDLVPGSLQFQWTDTQGNIVSNERGLEVAEPGIYTVQSMSATSTACPASTSILIKENTALPNLSAAGGALDAQHPTVQLAAKSTTFPVNYLWTGPNGFTSTLRRPIVSIAGFYTVTATNPQTGCASSVTVEVVQQ